MKNLIRRKDTRTVRFTRLAASALAVAAVVAGAAAIAAGQGHAAPALDAVKASHRAQGGQVQAPQAQARCC